MHFSRIHGVRKNMNNHNLRARRYWASRYISRQYQAKSCDNPDATHPSMYAGLILGGISRRDLCCMGVSGSTLHWYPCPSRGSLQQLGTWYSAFVDMKGLHDGKGESSHFMMRPDSSVRHLISYTLKIVFPHLQSLVANQSYACIILNLLRLTLIQLLEER